MDKDILRHSVIERLLWSFSILMTVVVLSGVR